MAGELPEPPQPAAPHARKPRLRVVSAPGAVFVLEDGQWFVELTPAQGDRLAAAILEQTKQARLLMSARDGRTLEHVT